ncbi:hypothetical protein CSA80_01435 [Candidatus Saccharibacteria bacterium]|nr:MAG: hypothetical protein CSA80_01435 [Candidatus Saccharibacteria bacterium]
MARLFPKENADFEVTISTHTIMRVIGLTALTVLLFLAVRESLHTLSLIGIAFFLSLALNNPVQWLANRLPAKKKNRRSLATGISVGLIFIILAGFLAAVVPPIAKQTSGFLSELPQLIDDTRNGEGALGGFVERYNLDSQVEKLSSELSSRLDNVSGSAVSALSKIGSSIFAMLAVLVLTVMMLVEGPKWVKLVEGMVPSSRRDRVRRIARDMNKVVQGYVNGQVILAAAAAILIVPMLFAMHVAYPLALMVVVFICGLIPMVGHTIGATITTLVALFTSPAAAIIVLAYYILYQQIENYVVQPKVQANSTNMSPLLVFIAVLLGASFGGLLGALVAIPVAGCMRILILDYLEGRNILSSATVKDAKTPGGDI